jgi:hypothetical protein
MITWQIEKENNSDKKLAIKHAAKQLEMKRFFQINEKLSVFQSHWKLSVLQINISAKIACRKAIQN